MCSFFFFFHFSGWASFCSRWHFANGGVRIEGCSSATQLHKTRTGLSIYLAPRFKGLWIHSCFICPWAFCWFGPCSVMKSLWASLISVLQTPQAHITPTVPHSGCCSLPIKKNGEGKHWLIYQTFLCRHPPMDLDICSGLCVTSCSNRLPMRQAFCRFSQKDNVLNEKHYNTGRNYNVPTRSTHHPSW